ncbi:MAG: transposase [bacterium]|nr:transposase [bacterium]
MSSKYTISDHQAPHFITFAVVQWIDALSRPLYKEIILDSLRYCQSEKGLILNAWVLMNNHVHLICSAAEGQNLSDILRDFKKYTSKSLLDEIATSSLESRKDWMLWLFKSNGQKNSNNKNYQFWQQDNRPIQLSTNEMLDQRLHYIHMNPVKEGIVYEAEHYVYSSARDYCGLKGLLNVDMIE